MTNYRLNIHDGTGNTPRPVDFQAANHCAAAEVARTRMGPLPATHTGELFMLLGGNPDFLHAFPGQG